VAQQQLQPLGSGHHLKVALQPQSASWTGTIPRGTHTITALVDDINRFAESDETNNKLSQPITIP
jgi:subtilase family serine protease